MKNNITCKRNYIVEEADIKAILDTLNKSQIYNRQKFQKKNTVSFYDDDNITFNTIKYYISSQKKIFYRYLLIKEH